MEKTIIIRDGSDLVEVQKWTKRVLNETYYAIERENHGLSLYFEVRFVIKEVANAVGPPSTGTDPNGC